MLTRRLEYSLSDNSKLIQLVLAAFGTWEERSYSLLLHPDISISQASHLAPVELPPPVYKDVGVESYRGGGHQVVHVDCVLGHLVSTSYSTS